MQHNYNDGNYLSIPTQFMPPVSCHWKPNVTVSGKGQSYQKWNPIFKLGSFGMYGWDFKWEPVTLPLNTFPSPINTHR